MLVSRIVLASAVVVVGVLSAAPAAAMPAPDATATQGPALTVPKDELDDAVRCEPSKQLREKRRTVLLVHGTGSTPHESFSWGYRRALHADGHGVCTVKLPDRGLGSFTTSAEYVVHAIRRAHRLAGRPIAVVGHSQGGTLPAWALQFWPDLSRRIDDIVAIASPFRGTAFADELCAAERCTALAWQSSRGSRTIAALQRAPFPAGTDLTSVATIHDEIVRPAPRVSRPLGPGTLVVAQDVCPADPVEHGLILGDPVTYAVTLDAIRHRGPADPSRLPASLCTQPFIPHGDPVGSVAFLETLASFGIGLTDPRRMLPREPRLPAYAAAYARP